MDITTSYGKLALIKKIYFPVYKDTFFDCFFSLFLFFFFFFWSLSLSFTPFHSVLLCSTFFFFCLFKFFSNALKFNTLLEFTLPHKWQKWLLPQPCEVKIKTYHLCNKRPFKWNVTPGEGRRLPPNRSILKPKPKAEDLAPARQVSDWVPRSSLG